MREASIACLNTIKRFEDEVGFLAGVCSRLTSYLCPANVWSIGWGHTHGVHEGMTISPQMADALLLEDVRAVELDLGLMFENVPFTQGAWDAIVSLCFNLKGGPRALPKKAPKLTAAIKAADWTTAAKELLDINKSNNVALDGLTRRRKVEAALMVSA